MPHVPLNNFTVPISRRNPVASEISNARLRTTAMASSSLSPHPRTTVTAPRGLIAYFGFILLSFCFISAIVNVWHGTSHGHEQFSMLQDLRSEDWKVTTKRRSQPQGGIRGERSNNNTARKDAIKRKGPTKRKSQLAGLNCDAYGGPSPEIAQEMVYWHDIPSDSDYVSPFKRKEEVQYMTFDPDEGGFNNIRMSMETVLAMAYAMGRTLVLPPDQPFYLLDKKHKNHTGHFGFGHFFHMESISKEHKGLEIISMKQFLEEHAMTGKMVNHNRERVSFPPNNRTDWDGEGYENMKQLSDWLRTVTYNVVWDPEVCMAAFPSTTGKEGIDRLNQIKQEIEDEGGFGTWHEYVGKPSPVDAPPKVRMRENWADRESLCIYSQEMQDAPVVHFPADARLLIHFYAFLFFEDWKQDLWMKRFVRDHVRYIDEIQCAAARVVHALRERAKSRNTTNTEGLYASFHVRRGDFQYKDTRVDADEIYAVSKADLIEGETVYIATDERDKSFFKPLVDHYDVVFLDDFKHLIEDLNSNLSGMLDQLVSSRGRVFFGCFVSTFSSYITRIIGYHVDSKELPGYETGAIPSYYYAQKLHRDEMQVFYPVKQTFWAREFPASWRRIDKGIDELNTSKK